ncbi:MAG TPA: 1-acyl-sn-glycerol-3-phosphate acyltransferase [Tepidisphaeraceae bacterium]|nr:1-acyl-sn-glycerol-3-phosphate acyltransferase [Tepidisphaeraceae bacterium]
MQNIIIDKPYVPVPPHRGKLWPRLLSFYLPRMLRKKFGVERVEVVHPERLRNSLAQGHGIMLAPNHCRDEDPFVLGVLSEQVGSPFFIMASWHLFVQSRLQTFLLTRAGAFSIYREGIDRTAVNTAVEMIETAQRPLVIFPEGFISRTNDRLNDLMEGTGLIVRSAAKKRAKLQPPGKVVVHPVAIRYRFHGDINSAATAVLDDVEARLTWRPLRELPLIDRIYKTGNALLSLKELEYVGHAKEGELGTRLKNLIEAILTPLEDGWMEGKHEGAAPGRVKKLRQAILPDMTKDELDEKERERRWKQLADLYLVQQLFNYPPDYVRSNATPERILETVERFEEDLTDRTRVHRPIHATVTVGEAIEVAPTREGRGAGDPLIEQIEHQLRAMLGLDGPA